MFVQEQLYKRSDLHTTYGGQTQGGISTPAQHPFILLFTSESGEQYGYRDGWSEDGIFLYTGEGQTGDMEFVRGNAAIRDHVGNGKDLHLFKYVQRGGHVRYIGQMICTGYQWRQGTDREGNPRQIIVFELTPLSEFTADKPGESGELEVAPSELSLEALRQRALGDARPTTTPMERKVAAYRRSQWIKAYALKRAGGHCEACGAPAPFLTRELQPFLEVHHIDRLSDGGPDAPDAVVAVCPNCHRRAHYAQDQAVFKEHLKQVVAALEQGNG